MCVIDKAPRTFTDQDRGILQDLAAIVVDELELRLAARRAETASRERVELLRAREREEMHLNDDVVQALAVAKMAIETGQDATALRRVTAALEAAKILLAEMGEVAESLRRDGPST